MDFIWLGFTRKNFVAIDERGQSTVEYILLFVVVTSIFLGIFRSQKFNEFFGQNGTIANQYRRQIEFTYRNGFSKSQSFSTPDYRSGDHESYSGRFFGAKDAYPRQ